MAQQPSFHRCGRGPPSGPDVTRRVQGEFRGEGEGERPLRDLHAVDPYRPVGFGLPSPHGDKLPVPHNCHRVVQLEAYDEYDESEYAALPVNLAVFI
jgi:hypothetical protein